MTGRRSDVFGLTIRLATVDGIVCDRCGELSAFVASWCRPPRFYWMSAVRERTHLCQAHGEEFAARNRLTLAVGALAA